MTDPRRSLQIMMERRGLLALYLSRRIGRNAAFVQQYLAGRFAKLNEDDQFAIAQELRMPERCLEARDPWSPIG